MKCYHLMLFQNSTGSILISNRKGYYPP